MTAPSPVLVGELNPYGADPRYALFPYPRGASGDRLCHLVMGLSDAEYLRRFSRVNLCTGKWSARAARETVRQLVTPPPEKAPGSYPCPTSAGSRLAPAVHPLRGALAGGGRVAVLLGTKVADAFGVPFEPFAVRELRRTVLGRRAVLDETDCGKTLGEVDFSWSEESVALVLSEGFRNCTPALTEPVRVVVLPHPSGLNRLWNELGALERARGALRGAGVLP